MKAKTKTEEKKGGNETKWNNTEKVVRQTERENKERQNKKVKNKLKKGSQKTNRKKNENEKQRKKEDEKENRKNQKEEKRMTKKKKKERRIASQWMILWHTFAPGDLQIKFTAVWFLIQTLHLQSG